tara:strand:+ start:597 stop:830 length:234 start_codon:yes stop_codon:yes gene_type:complete
MSIEKKYKQIFGSTEGQKVLEDLLLFCGHNKAKPNEANLLHRVIGREDVALHILARLKEKEDLIEDINTNNLNIEEF